MARRSQRTKTERAAWLVLVVGLGGALSCIEPRAFVCEQSDACVLAGVRGRCEPEGYCSYPDDDCDSGSRFESLAPGELRGRCVEPGQRTSTGDESTDAGPADDCGERPCTIKGLAVGDAHSCVRDGFDALWCWGDNAFGQLGRGGASTEDRCPAPTVALGVVVQASASRHMCALDDRGDLSCWGDNDRGQVDWSNGAEPFVPTPRLRSADQILIEPAVIDVGPDLSCAAHGSTVSCWGVVGPPMTLTTDGAVQVLAAGAQHACAVLQDGLVQCSGLDGSGQLGDGTPAAEGMMQLEQSEPISGGASFVDAGYFHTCALVTAALGPEVQCWGANESGQSGSAVEAIVTTPTRVPYVVPGPHRSLALGARHSCVLAMNGTVQCWGDNGAGQVSPGAPTRSEPYTVELEGEDLRAIEIGAGQAHTCARTADDGVVCWGDNGALQLGAPPSETSRAVHWLDIGCE